MNEQCKNCQEKESCSPFFAHEDTLMHYNHANKRMLIALLTVCAEQFQPRAQAFRRTFGKLVLIEDLGNAVGTGELQAGEHVKIALSEIRRKHGSTSISLGLFENEEIGVHKKKKE